jgi:5-methylcytosine-specific restriction endonuclease McrA
MADKRKYSDRAEYLKKAVAKRRKKIREMALDRKGAKCSLCGYSKCFQALEFHHINEADKDFSISTKGYTRSWEKVKAEIDKCILVCANCHRELHAGVKQSSKKI